MKAKLLKVKTPNKMLFIRGRLVRTPLEHLIKFEAELRMLKMSMLNQNIDFELEDYNPEKPKVKKSKKVKKVKEKIKPQKKATTLLEKIQQEE